MPSKYLSNIFFLIATGVYAVLFWRSMDGRWFSPHWTTDDAVQQVYPFWKAIDPELFKDDIVTQVMEGYLAPLHYWLNFMLTTIFNSPIMASHVVMLIQLLLALVFLGLAVQHVCQAWPPAFFACAWLLHTRTVIMRMTGGLPRGWAVPLVAGFVYCVLTGKHRLMLLVIGMGCVLNPPTTFLITFCYGLWLLYLSFNTATAQEGRPALKQLLCLAPVFILVVWLVVQKPPEIGAMVSYEQASQMPAFQSGGRFPFLPLPSITSHLQRFGYNPFINRLHEPNELIKTYGGLFVVAALIFLLVAPVFYRRQSVPGALWIFLIGILAVYYASRHLLFYLYVPDRHLLVPLSIFLIAAFSCGVWQFFAHGYRTQNYLRASIAMLLLGITIYLGSGLGFVGDANFNYYYRRSGLAFEWLANNSNKSDLIAGHPTHVNPVPLFAKRKVYVSSEVAHPFYPVYYAEMERRIEKSLRAHYAGTVSEFMQLLDGEQIDYFVFSRQRFYGSSLAKETYYEPFNSLLRQLVSRNHLDFAYKKFPKRVNIDKFPFMPFRDDQSVIIDLKKLKEYLQQNPGTEEFSTEESV